MVMKVMVMRRMSGRDGSTGEDSGDGVDDGDDVARVLVW